MGVECVAGERSIPVGKRIAVCLAPPEQMRRSLTRPASFVVNHTRTGLVLGCPSFADQRLELGTSFSKAFAYNNVKFQGSIFTYPRCSMYVVIIYLHLQLNVGKYAIH